MPLSFARRVSRKPYLTFPSKLPAVAGSVIGSLGAAFGAQLALLVSGIIAARILGPEDRGYFALLVLVPSLITIVALLGVNNAIPYFIARDILHTRSLLRSLKPLLIAQLIIGTLVHIVILVVMLEDGGSGIEGAAAVTLVSVTSMIIQLYCLAIVQGLGRFRRLNTLRLLPTFPYALAVSVLALNDHGSLTVIATAWSASNVVATVIMVFAARTVLVEMNQASGLHSEPAEIVRFGLKGFLGSASPLETFRVDQIFIGLFLSPSALGIYVAALAFTNLPRFIAQSLGIVAYPYIAAQHNERQARRSTKLFFWLSIISTSAIVAALIVSADWLVPLAFGDQFRDAVLPLQILLLGGVFSSGRRVLGEALRGQGYPAANTWAEVVSWIWMLPTVVVFIPRWGLIGVAAAQTSAAAASLAALLFIESRIYHRATSSHPKVSTDDRSGNAIP